MNPDPHDRSIAIQAALHQIRADYYAENECDCPPGAWHLRSCPVAYWPAGLRETEENDA